MVAKIIILKNWPKSTVQTRFWVETHFDFLSKIFQMPRIL